MDVKFIVKSKNTILVIGFLLFFIILQIPIDGIKGQEFFSLFEAIKVFKPSASNVVGVIYLLNSSISGL